MGTEGPSSVDQDVGPGDRSRKTRRRRGNTPRAASKPVARKSADFQQTTQEQPAPPTNERSEAAMNGDNPPSAPAVRPRRRLNSQQNGSAPTQDSNADGNKQKEDHAAVKITVGNMEQSLAVSCPVQQSVVDSLINRGEIAMLAARPNTGKIPFIAQLVSAVASGSAVPRPGNHALPRAADRRRITAAGLSNHPRSSMGCAWSGRKQSCAVSRHVCEGSP